MISNYGYWPNISQNQDGGWEETKFFIRSDMSCPAHQHAGRHLGIYFFKLITVFLSFPSFQGIHSQRCGGSRMRSRCPTPAEWPLSSRKTDSAPWSWPTCSPQTRGCTCAEPATSWAKPCARPKSEWRRDCEGQLVSAERPPCRKPTWQEAAGCCAQPYRTLQHTCTWKSKDWGSFTVGSRFQSLTPWTFPYFKC